MSIELCNGDYKGLLITRNGTELFSAGYYTATSKTGKRLTVEAHPGVAAALALSAVLAGIAGFGAYKMGLVGKIKARLPEMNISEKISGLFKRA